MQRTRQEGESKIKQLEDAVEQLMEQIKSIEDEKAKFELAIAKPY